MKTRTTKAVAATALTALSLMLASGAEAALVERLGGKAIYDDVADLTWLQDASYAQTTGYDADGRMNWVQANAWAGSLNIDGVTGWRLPGGPMLGFGTNQTASEMGNLFYNVLGGTAGSSITTSHNANYNLFKNVQPLYYWSGVERYSSIAWYFDFDVGVRGTSLKNYNLFGWAVRSGDVGASPVPVPGALALMGPALLGLLGVKRSRRRA
ncbi:MAG: DUF1566 domain-containing protein [Gammaproteobacteria bacterium]|nr:DUF1566 domain-containing protein [Gammaproteobacteria bacterium]